MSGDWHARTAAEALAVLDSSPTGLSASEATQRVAQFGPNRLSPPTPISAISILAAQFRGVVMLLLVSAAVVSFALGERIDAAAIGIVIAINVTLGFSIELRARRAMEGLLQLGAARASVVREGRLYAVDSEVVVPGDVIELAAGQTVPADARVISETDLRTNEAALTGESLPVSKQAPPALGEDTPLANRINMVYRGTTVAAGIARAVVTSTGNSTEVGRIGTLTRSVAEESTPLERRLDALGRRLAWLALGAAALVGLLGVLQGAPWGLMIETAIALSVAAVPEGLPAVATIALAVGLRRMARRQALVRRLSAVEALGSTTVICTDKTRTLTTGDMSVVRVWVSGAEYTLGANAAERDIPHDARLVAALETAVLASRAIAQNAEGVTLSSSVDPVDAAILRAAASVGIDTVRLLETAPAGRIPFSSEQKFAASFHDRAGSGLAAFVKGAPRTIVGMCDRESTAAGEVPLSEHTRAHLLAINEQLASQGLRVLAIAAGRTTAASEEALRGLTFTGFVGMMDPPAPGVKDTIARLRQAGLRTVMLTGDQRLTAEAIGRQLGVLSSTDEALDSREWRAMNQAARDARLPHVGAFSRISAEDKLTIVAALQARQEIVAMLGDGVNDAPALRKADVGVAMGLRGTDVAKEAASIVLQDDRFETIAAAVEEGRVIADNISKFVFYLFSCNLAEVLVLLIAGLLGLPSPLLPLQILWLNLVTDTFPALALALEPGDRDVMQRPPRDPHEAILSTPFLRRVLFYAGLIVLGTLVALFWGMRHPGTNATTMAFMTLALGQIFHLGNARSDQSVLRPSAAFSNRYAVGAAIVSGLLQVLPLYVAPIGAVLHVAPLTVEEWAVVLACSGVAAVVGQTIKVRRDQ
jgi:P-type Ca2+ transporter type 2C